MICIVELLNRCGDVLPEVLTLPHLLVVTPFHVLHEPGEIVTLRRPVCPLLDVSYNVRSNPLLNEPISEHSRCDSKRLTRLNKRQRLILLRRIIYQCAAANSAFNQFQTAVVAETGKVSGRSVRATYSLIGIAASAVLILVSMLLPYLSSEYGSASTFTVKGGYSAFHLVLLMTVVGLGAAYWFTNQKWAYLSAGIGALVAALLGVIQFIVALNYDYIDAGFGAFMLGLFSIAIGVAGGFQVPQAGQPQFGQQAQFGQQQGQQPQLGDKPYNPFGPQA